MSDPPTPPSAGRWRRFSLALAVVAGFAAGVLASSILDLRPPHRSRDRVAAERQRDRDGGRESRRRDRGPGGEGRIERFREHLESSLDLDESQRARLAEFLERNHAEASAFWEETRERYRELRLRFRGQIREMLNDSQRERFDELFRESGGGDAADSDAGSPAAEPDAPGPGASSAPSQGVFP